MPAYRPVVVACALLRVPVRDISRELNRRICWFCAPFSCLWLRWCGPVVRFAAQKVRAGEAGSVRLAHGEIGGGQRRSRRHGST